MKPIKIVINPNEFKDRTFTTSEIGRGIGIQKPKKGKGSYSRKEKHKRQHTGDYGMLPFHFLQSSIKESTSIFLQSFHEFFFRYTPSIPVHLL